MLKAKPHYPQRNRFEMAAHEVQFETKAVREYRIKRNKLDRLPPLKGKLTI